MMCCLLVQLFVSDPVDYSSSASQVGGLSTGALPSLIALPPPFPPPRGIRSARTLCGKYQEGIAPLCRRLLAVRVGLAIYLLLLLCATLALLLLRTEVSLDAAMATLIRFVWRALTGHQEPIMAMTSDAWTVGGGCSLAVGLACSWLLVCPAVTVLQVREGIAKTGRGDNMYNNSLNREGLGIQRV